MPAVVACASPQRQAGHSSGLRIVGTRRLTTGPDVRQRAWGEADRWPRADRPRALDQGWGRASGITSASSPGSVSSSHTSSPTRRVEGFPQAASSARQGFAALDVNEPRGRTPTVPTTDSGFARHGRPPSRGAWSGGLTMPGPRADDECW